MSTSKIVTYIVIFLISIMLTLFINTSIKTVDGDNASTETVTASITTDELAKVGLAKAYYEHACKEDNFGLSEESNLSDSSFYYNDFFNFTNGQMVNNGSDDFDFNRAVALSNNSQLSTHNTDFDSNTFIAYIVRGYSTIELAQENVFNEVFSDKEVFFVVKNYTTINVSDLGLDKLYIASIEQLKYDNELYMDYGAFSNMPYVYNDSFNAGFLNTTGKVFFKENVVYTYEFDFVDYVYDQETATYTSTCVVPSNAKGVSVVKPTEDVAASLNNFLINDKIVNTLNLSTDLSALYQGEFVSDLEYGNYYKYNNFNNGALILDLTNVAPYNPEVEEGVVKVGQAFNYALEIEQEVEQDDSFWGRVGDFFKKNGSSILTGLIIFIISLLLSASPVLALILGLAGGLGLSGLLGNLTLPIWLWVIILLVIVAFVIYFIINNLRR